MERRKTDDVRRFAKAHRTEDGRKEIARRCSRRACRIRSPRMAGEGYTQAPALGKASIITITCAGSARENSTSVVTSSVGKELGRFSGAATEQPQHECRRAHAQAARFALCRRP